MGAAASDHNRALGRTGLLVRRDVLRYVTHFYVSRTERNQFNPCPRHTLSTLPRSLQGLSRHGLSRWSHLGACCSTTHRYVLLYIRLQRSLYLVPGVLADNSKSRFGRRRPYMLVGCIVCVLAMMLLGFTRPFATVFLPAKSIAVSTSMRIRPERAIDTLSVRTTSLPSG